MNLSQNDIDFLEQNQLSIEEIEKQVGQLMGQPVFPEILEPVSDQNGVSVLSEKQIEYYAHLSEQISEQDIIKFIPASGAASRMFGFLIKWLKKPKSFDTSLEIFFENLKSFPFYHHLRSQFDFLRNPSTNLSETNKITVLNYLLFDTGLNYSQLPKAIIPFHQYSEQDIRMPFEEHILESSQLLQNQCSFHFTLSPEHKNIVEQIIQNNITDLESRINRKLHIELSHQETSTSTVALDHNNNIVRNPEGKILLRPGGHGALLKNLNRINKPFIIIRNIDNIPLQKFWDQRIRSQKILLGIAREVKTIRDSIENFIRNHQLEKALFEFNRFIQEFNLPYQPSDMKEVINAPFRVVGVVKNEGEPGGGPFVINDQGKKKLQILETSQISEKNLAIMEKSKYFNPTDMVVCPVNMDNKKYDLNQFVDQNQILIANKHFHGEDIRVLERPGLWNGSMAYFNTIFVEIPVENFAPVKSVLDLLRPAHQIQTINSF